MPETSRPALGEALQRWRRYPVRGTSLNPSERQAWLSAAERDFRGAVRALADH